MEVALIVALLAASFVLHWLESLWAKAKLKDYLESQGWTVQSARWQPRWPMRQARFRIEVERGADRATGTAFVGGDWTGPVWSRVLDVEWETG